MPNRRLKVLAVDDDMVDRMAFERQVAKEALPYDVTFAESVATAEQALGEREFDIVISDFSLGDGTGLDVLRIVERRAPVVVVTGTGDQALAVKAIKRGAADYMVKDHERTYLRLLPLVIERAIAEFERRQAAERSRAEIERLAKERAVLVEELEEARKRDLATYARKLASWIDRYHVAARASGRILYDVGSAEASFDLAGDLEGILGYSKGGWTFAEWCAMIHPADREAYERKSAEVKAKGDAYAHEYRVRRKDGSYVWIEDQGLCLRSAGGGEVVRIVGFMSDVTERRRMREIEEERNHLANAMQAMDKVLGIVGHELRTPLAGLRAMAEFLLYQRRDSQEPPHPFIGQMHAEILRMVGMVNDLLEVARLNSGTAKWNWGSVELADLCDQAIVSVEPLVDGAKIALDSKISSTRRSIRGDAEALRRLLVNLLVNATKHTEKGSITIEAMDDPLSPAHLVLQVSDTGSGIPPEILDRLGQAFALNSGVIGESYVKGSGLGLAICKGIAAAHGGSIGVTSSSSGSTFVVRIRAELEAPSEDLEQSIAVLPSPVRGNA